MFKVGQFFLLFLYLATPFLVDICYGKIGLPPPPNSQSTTSLSNCEPLRRYVEFKQKSGTPFEFPINAFAMRGNSYWFLGVPSTHKQQQQLVNP